MLSYKYGNPYMHRRSRIKTIHKFILLFLVLHAAVITLWALYFNAPKIQEKLYSIEIVSRIQKPKEEIEKEVLPDGGKDGLEPNDTAMYVENKPEAGWDDKGDPKPALPDVHNKPKMPEMPPVLAGTHKPVPAAQGEQRGVNFEPGGQDNDGPGGFGQDYGKGDGGGGGGGGRGGGRPGALPPDPLFEASTTRGSWLHAGIRPTHEAYVNIEQEYPYPPLIEANMPHPEELINLGASTGTVRVRITASQKHPAARTPPSSYDIINIDTSDRSNMSRHRAIIERAVSSSKWDMSYTKSREAEMIIRVIVHGTK